MGGLRLLDSSPYRLLDSYPTSQNRRLLLRSPRQTRGAADGRPIPVSDACSRGAELPDGPALEAPDERHNPDAGGGSWGWTPRNAPGPGTALASLHMHWHRVRTGRRPGTIAR